MNRPVVVAGTAGAAVTALAIAAVTWGWWRELVGKAVDEVTIDLTGLGGDDDEVLQWTNGTIPQAVLDQMNADAIERAARELAAVIERKVAHAASGDSGLPEQSDGTIPQAVLDQMNAVHEEFAVRNERLMTWLATGIVDPDEIRHYYVKGGGAHGGRADLAAAGEGLGASLDLGGEVGGSPNDDGPLADRLRAEITAIETELQASWFSPSWLPGVQYVLRQILAVLDEQ